MSPSDTALGTHTYASNAHERPNSWFLDIFLSNQWRLSLPALLKRKSIVCCSSLSLSPLPSWIEKANLVTKDTQKPEAKVASSLR